MTESVSRDRSSEAVSPPARTSPVRVNLVANGAGAVATSAIQFVVIRVYLQTMGVEAYGLVGVLATLQSLVQLADFGVSAGVNRELARRTALAVPARDIRDMVRTLEVGYGAVGGVLGLLVFLAAPWAEAWLRHDQLSTEMVRRSVQAMGPLIAIQWFLSFYQNALLGLQRHLLLNAIRIGMSAAAAVGSWIVLTRVSATPVALFVWLTMVTGAQVATSAVVTWRHLPRDSRRPAFRPSSLAGLWTFAAGMAGVTATALLLSQMDRIVGSRMLPLDIFGAYMIGATLANALLYTFTGPVYASFFPRLTALAALNDRPALWTAYRRAWALMAIVVVPAAAALSVFARPLVLAWTGDAAAAVVAAPVAVLLLSGMALNGLVSVPLALQLARNWTGLALTINSALCVIALPALWMLVRLFGATGAAAVWPGLNICYAVASVSLTHRRLGAHEYGWLLRDVVVPILVAVAVAWLGRRVLPEPVGFIAVVAGIGATWAAASIAMGVLSAPLRESALRLAGSLSGRGLS